MTPSPTSLPLPSCQICRLPSGNRLPWSKLPKWHQGAPAIGRSSPTTIPGKQRRPIIGSRSATLPAPTGLSVASVSRALSGARPVRPEVGQRVEEAAAALGYRPNPVARALSLGSTSTIGLIVPDMLNPFFPQLADAVERALRSADLSMLLMNAENDPAWEKNCISQLSDRRVDGLLISATHRVKSRADRRSRRGRPGGADRPLREP